MKKKNVTLIENVMGVDIDSHEWVITPAITLTFFADIFISIEWLCFGLYICIPRHTRIFCNHNYIDVHTHCLGMNPPEYSVICKCTKCGKVKTVRRLG